MPSSHHSWMLVWMRRLSFPATSRASRPWVMTTGCTSQCPWTASRGGIEALSDVLPHLMAPLSLTLLPSESPEVDWDEQWLGLEACLELCGSSAGLVMVDELTVRHVCGDEDVDVDEVAADWAAVHGLALIVVGGADRASAVKPDGRVEFVTVDADRTLTGMNGSVGFLSGYLTDPSDLPRALQRMSVV